MTHPPSYGQFLQQMAAGRQGASLWRFGLVFLLTFFLLQWSYQALSDTALYRFYIETLTAQPAAAVIRLIVPADGVTAAGHRLAWQGGRLSILNGCDGAEVMELLIAAFAAVAGSWRMKLTGMASGVLLVYVLNQVRLVALYFAVRHDRALFDLIHGLAGPLVIIALATLFFALWIAPREPQTAA
jgi:exosortase family protein XrtM